MKTSGAIPRLVVSWMIASVPPQSYSPGDCSTEPQGSIVRIPPIPPAGIMLRSETSGRAPS